MPAWNDLLAELESQPSNEEKSAWLSEKQRTSLATVSALRSGRNVLFYASAFLQKPMAPGLFLSISPEEINGFMSCVYGMDCKRGLTLLLHTPGGIPTAAETVVAYLWSKFSDIEVIVPTYAMSAGTMISLAANRVIMGRQSQLGPIDPQLAFRERYVSAQAVVDQFEQARSEILTNRDLAHLWAPVLQALGPALLQESRNALAYGERMVASWLESRMFAGRKDSRKIAAAAAKHFNDASSHKSHGRRIDRDEARSVGIEVEDLESDQRLQEAVLTAYHLATLVFEKTPATKILFSHEGRAWMKNASSVAG